jgi:ATP diphosphatase
MTSSRDIVRLLEIMAALRTPRTGCPWDLAQDFSTIAPYTLEEAYEVADAIARGNLADLKEELGDLLLQVVFHSRMAEEQRAFDFGDVVQAITEKLIRRHPHVFADEDLATPQEVEGLWERIKAQEKSGNKTAVASRGNARGNGRALAGGKENRVNAQRQFRSPQRSAAREGTENLALTDSAFSGSARTVMAMRPS